MTTNRQWVYNSRPEGLVGEDHYKLVTQDIPEPGQGELLVKSLFFSVDPYMRIQQAASDTWEKPHPLGTVQGGGVVGKVIKSNSPDIAQGSIVSVYTGWQEYAVVAAASARVITWDQADASLSCALGVLGMPGRTAYFGLLEAGKPKEGETVVVSGAAGAVGSIVIQLAKIHGCRTVGIAGSPGKLKYLQEELGVDAVINYKEHSTLKEFDAAIKGACPNGVDVYFDNTGGVATDAVFLNINTRARVVICGQISQYNGSLDTPELGPRFLHRLIYTRATIQGILARDFTDRHETMVQAHLQWIKEGKLKYHETVDSGFEHLPKSLQSLFHGHNTGKLVVKAE